MLGMVQKSFFVTVSCFMVEVLILAEFMRMMKGNSFVIRLLLRIIRHQIEISLKSIKNIIENRCFLYFKFQLS